MIKPNDPRELAVALLKRSTCHIQVAAVLADRFGCYAWGWNGVGISGYGEHAEAATIRRANRRRLAGSTLYVAAVRHRTGKPVIARPCAGCQRLIRRVGTVAWRDNDSSWRLL